MAKAVYDASTLLRHLATAPHRIQELFDNYRRESLDAVAAALPPEVLAFLRDVGIDAIVPPALRMERFIAEIDIRIRRSESREFAFEVAPLNLGYSTRFEQSKSSHSKITLHIEAHRLPSENG